MSINYYIVAIKYGIELNYVQSKLFNGNAYGKSPTKDSNCKYYTKHTLHSGSHP